MKFINVEDRDLTEVKPVGILAEGYEPGAYEFERIFREACLAWMNSRVDPVSLNLLMNPGWSREWLPIWIRKAGDHDAIDGPGGEGSRSVDYEGPRDVIPKISPDSSRQVEAQLTLHEIRVCEPKDAELPRIHARAVALPGWNRDGGAAGLKGAGDSLSPNGADVGEMVPPSIQERPIRTVESHDGELHGGGPPLFHILRNLTIRRSHPRYPSTRTKGVGSPPRDRFR